MKIRVLTAIAALLILSSCAGLMRVSEELMPLHYRMISSNGLIKNFAAAEYQALDAAGRQAVLNNIAGIIGRESDPDTQMRALLALKELEAGPSVIVPLLLAVKNNTELKIYNALLGYVREVKPPDSAQLREILPYIKDASWEVSLLAMTAVSKMAGAAKTAVPEIAQAMRRFGSDADKYFASFDFLSMVDPQISIKIVISDLLAPDSKIRRNAAEKLFEIQAYMGPKVKQGGLVMQALIRALFSGDKEVSDIAQEALSEISDPEARKAVETFLKAGAAAINMLSKITGYNPQETYKKQESEVVESIRKYYIENGREEEALKIK